MFGRAEVSANRRHDSAVLPPSFMRFPVLLAAVLAGAAAAQPARWTADDWREDLDYLRVQIGTYHENPYHTQDPLSMRAQFEALHDAIPTMTDFEIAFAMQGCVAALGDGHSWLDFEGKDLSRYFLFEAYEFSDGLFITRAAPGLERLDGARIVAIEGKPLSEIRDTFTPYISRDNAIDLKRQLPLFVRQPTALHAAGITARRDQAEFSLVGEDGTAFTHVLSDVSAAAYRDWFLGEPPPHNGAFYLQKQDEPYWYRELEEDGALYFQFNQFTEKPTRKFAEFLDEMFALGEARALECLIIDLRHNLGGQIALVDPLVKRLREHSHWSAEGHLYVITGRVSFSAALMLAVRLERFTGAIFAGEPGRGKPNSYGGFGPFELPNTGLTGSLAHAYFNESEIGDPRTALDVQLPAPLSYADFRDGRDPALDEVLRHWRAQRPAVGGADKAPAPAMAE